MIDSEVPLTCAECRAALTRQTAWASVEWLALCFGCALAANPAICRECRGWGCKRRCVKKNAKGLDDCEMCGGKG